MSRTKGALGKKTLKKLGKASKKEVTKVVPVKKSISNISVIADKIKPKVKSAVVNTLPTETIVVNDADLLKQHVETYGVPPKNKPPVYEEPETPEEP